MKTLQIVNIQKQPLAEITWEAPDKLTVEVFDQKYATEINFFVDGVRQKGIPMRTGKSEEKSNLMVDERVTIGLENEKFLQVLSDVVGRLKFGGQRVFGVIK